MVDSSKVLNPYEKNVFLQISNAFKTAGMKKNILDYTISKAVQSLRIVQNLVKQNKGYRDIPHINKAFAWSYKSLNEFINEYPNIKNAIRYEKPDAIVNNKLIADIKYIENILLQLPRQSDPKSISNYESNQLDRMLEDLKDKYKENEEKFYELQQAQDDLFAANIVDNICIRQSSRISQDASTQKLNDSIIEDVEYRFAHELFSNTVEIAKRRLNQREINLKKNIQDAEENIRTAEVIHSTKMDFNNNGIENYAREIERYTTEFTRKVEKLNDQINVTKFRVREYRKLNQSVYYHIQLYENAMKQLQKQKKELEYIESENGSPERLGSELQVEHSVE